MTTTIANSILRPTITLTINGKEYQARSGDELTPYLQQLKFTSYNEIWATQSDCSSLCLLTNSSRAFVLYLRYPGDSGLIATTNDQVTNTMIEFKLSNGQLDEYPARWTVPVHDALKILTSFIQDNNLLSYVNWIKHTRI